LWRLEHLAKNRFAIVKAATPNLEKVSRHVCSVATQQHHTGRASCLPPKARIAGGIDNFWKNRRPATWANIAAAKLAMQDTDVTLGYLQLARVANPNMRAVGCRLGFNAHKAMLPCTIKVKRHDVWQCAAIRESDIAVAAALLSTPGCCNQPLTGDASSFAEAHKCSSSLLA
jgi:hypothetical protein